MSISSAANTYDAKGIYFRSPHSRVAMEVYTTSMVPSTSNEPSSLDSHHFDRVCSQRFCGILLWPGSKNDLCDRCLARIEVYNASVNPRDAARAYAKTASRVEDAFRNPKDLKEVRSVAPAVPGSAVCSVCCDSVLWI